MINDEKRYGNNSTSVKETYELLKQLLIQANDHLKETDKKKEPLIIISLLIALFKFYFSTANTIVVSIFESLIILIIGTIIVMIIANYQMWHYIYVDTAVILEKLINGLSRGKYTEINKRIIEDLYEKIYNTRYENCIKTNAEQCQSSRNNISIGDVLRKYKDIVFNTTSVESKIYLFLVWIMSIFIIIIIYDVSYIIIQWTWHLVLCCTTTLACKINIGTCEWNVSGIFPFTLTLTLTVVISIPLWTRYNIQLLEYRERLVTDKSNFFKQNWILKFILD